VSQEHLLDLCIFIGPPVRRPAGPLHGGRETTDERGSKWATASPGQLPR
jgi:hypothetical protein